MGCSFSFFDLSITVTLSLPLPAVNPAGRSLSSCSMPLITTVQLLAVLEA
uniref:Uncharacterized protein n=1 Tax=Physcomitrium patens TaxID=3218 RepID=A0A2K1JHN5_PHYPA|nr:hypothetical protein PHYPA_018432 [Physcomitrium patens]